MTTPGIRRNWRQVRAGVPAVGAQWSMSGGGQRWWRIVSLVARLTTSAVVANRRVRLTASDGGNIYWLAESPLDQPASTTVDYTAHTGQQLVAASSLALPLPLPSGGLLLRPGAVLASVATGFDVADQWSNVVSLVEEVPSGAPYQGDQLILPPEIVGE